MKTGKILYILAAILIICWAIGFFCYRDRAVMIVLPIVALISIIIGIMIDKFDKITRNL